VALRGRALVRRSPRRLRWGRAGEPIACPKSGLGRQASVRTKGSAGRISSSVVPVPPTPPPTLPNPARRPPTTRIPAGRATERSHDSRPGDPAVTYTSDVGRERERADARCRGMRVSITITRPPHHSTGVAAAADGAVTLGVHQSAAMRRPCESTTTAARPTSGCFVVPIPRSLRGVTESHPLTSPGSGAVVTGVRKLTCSAISNPRRQGGDEPMSLAPEVR
jgi:hypothetical protein